MFRILTFLFGVACLALAALPGQEGFVTFSLLTRGPDDFTERLITTPFGTFEPATVCWMSGAIAGSLVFGGLVLIEAAVVGERPARTSSFSA